MSPMSWYSGSQRHAELVRLGVVVRHQLLEAPPRLRQHVRVRERDRLRIHRRARRELDQRQRRRPSTGGRRRTHPLAAASATFRQPERAAGRARTASPSSRRTRRIGEHHARARRARSMRAVGAWYSSIRPRRTGGYSGTGTAPASSAPKNASMNSGAGGEHQRHAIARAHAERRAARRRPAPRARGPRRQRSAVSVSLRSTKVSPRRARGGARCSAALRVAWRAAGWRAPWSRAGFTRAASVARGARSARDRPRSARRPRPPRSASRGTGSPARPRAP